MPRSAGLPLILSLVLTLLLGACGRRASDDDVRLRIEGAALRVENRSSDELFYVLIGPGFAADWVPSTMPANRIEAGRFKRWRVAPSDWGGRVQLWWWRPADDPSGAGPAPDRLRKLTLTLDEPNPLPADEQLVRACVVVKSAEGALPRGFNPEAFCMKEAEDCLARGGVECATQASGWQKMQREMKVKP